MNPCTMLSCTTYILEFVTYPSMYPIARVLIHVVSIIHTVHGHFLISANPSSVSQSLYVKQKMRLGQEKLMVFSGTFTILSVVINCSLFLSYINTVPLVLTWAAMNISA